jgi:hypothetical protein
VPNEPYGLAALRRENRARTGNGASVAPIAVVRASAAEPLGSIHRPVPLWSAGKGAGCPSPPRAATRRLLASTDRLSAPLPPVRPEPAGRRLSPIPSKAALSPLRGAAPLPLPLALKARRKGALSLLPAKLEIAPWGAAANLEKPRPVDGALISIVAFVVQHNIAVWPDGPLEASSLRLGGSVCDFQRSGCRRWRGA